MKTNRILITGLRDKFNLPREPLVILGVTDIFVDSGTLTLLVGGSEREKIDIDDPEVFVHISPE